MVGQELRVFFDDQIHFSNQPVALAIANTFEQATYAASLVQVTYQAEPHQTDISMATDKAYPTKRSEDYARG